ncbi:MAG: 23S rRNA (adenine(2503)-C2)-methyltransferase [Spirochaetes bacterium]|nr:MAG: 23S rRNA (adenine(2503)-C2)-methyltransferase [Spirochaetota bacterium]
MQSLNKISLAGLLPEDINKTFSLTPAYRGVQIFESIYKGLSDINKATAVPLYLRKKLSEYAVIFSSRVLNTFEDKDKTVKLRLKLKDGKYTETVLLVDKRGRKTACLSSQVGCPMSCAFCNTGRMGFSRNLETAEIVEQFLHLRNRFGNISNIVFMGMGEPLLNLESVRQSITILTHPRGAGIGHKKITISTCGVIRGIVDLAEKGPHVHLAVSLISANQKLREKLMPVAKSNTLEKLKEALSFYQNKTGDRITLEYVLIEGINDRAEDIRALEKFIGHFKSLVNLIPLNPTDNSFRAPSGENLRRFYIELKRKGIPVSKRYRRGRGVQAACGQLYVRVPARYS